MASEVDCSGSSRAVWLVKVPKYLANVWNQADESGVVGSLMISKSSKDKEVIFQLSDSLAKATAEKFPAPNEHKLILSKVEQSQAVFSESIKTGSNEKSDEKEEEEDTNNDICLEGVVMQRADCKPIQTPQYMDLKKQSILSSRAPSRRAQQLNSAIFPIYKPVSKHKADEEHEKKQKLEGKRARAEKADVLDMLFKAFERHQYYYMKDLIKITQQPSVSKTFYLYINNAI